MKDNNGMRGTWHFTGQYWFCDCYGEGPLLRVHVGQGGSMTGKAHSPNTSRCRRCGCLQPLARDRPELTENVRLPCGIEEVTGEEREKLLARLKE